MSLRTPLLVLAVAVVVAAAGSIALVGAAVTDRTVPAEATPTAASGPTETGADQTVSPSAASTARDRPATGSAAAIAQQRRPTDPADVERVDFLEVRSTGEGEYAYRMQVRGYVQKARVSDRVKAETNDDLRRNADGTVTVVGTTGNQQSDAYTYVGEVVAFEQIRGESGGQLLLNGLALSRSEFLNADIFEVVSTDEDREIRYRFSVRGTVERTSTGEDVAAGNNDRIVDNGDGTVTVTGVTGNERGDAYRVQGTVLDFRRTGGDSGFFLRLDGLEVASDTLTPAGLIEGADDDGDGDDGDDRRRIDSCTRIERPGTYVLTGDVRNTGTDACIEVRADDVTVDGNGNSLVGGDGSRSVGVDVAPSDGESVDDVRVVDLTVRDWGTGVRVDATSRARADGIVIRDVTSASNVGHGVSLRRTTDSRVVDTTVRGNGLAGVIFEDSGTDNVVTGSTATGNDGFGVVVFDGARGLRVVDNRVANNGRGGIQTSNDDRDTLIARNVVAANDGSGMSLSDSSRLTVRANTVRENGDSGVSLSDVSAAVVADNEVTRNARFGVALRYTADSRVVDNAVRRNGDSGIALVSARNNVVVGNVVCGNDAPEQVLLTADSTGNRVEDNRLTC